MREGVKSMAFSPRLSLTIAATLAGLALTGSARAQEPTGIAPVPTMQQLPAGATTLSVLTYNVEGLPFPFARSRGAAAQQIADRLKTLRAGGQQPHVVVLQEAFGEAQKAIGRDAGYRYTAFGPSKHTKSDEAMTDEDRAFAAKARFLKGEDVGKWRSSGLAILSDYPIVSVKKAAFPAWACAGFDCLANKGVLMAEIQVPGIDKPVAVIVTHMNSKDTSGVGKDRWNGAFNLQARTIGSFLAKNLDPTVPYIFAGDTNIGKSAERRAWFEQALNGLPRGSANQEVRTALATCLVATSACTVEAPTQAAKSLRRGKDLQVYADGATVKIQPLGIGVPFGADENGHMLSDHIGYTAVYRLSQIGQPTL
jgi:endonuclease/exonuclease/phosphatase family metal-dependent hydrolase